VYPQKTCLITSAEFNGKISLHNLFSKPSVCEIIVPRDNLVVGGEIHEVKFLTLSKRHREEASLCCKCDFIRRFAAGTVCLPDHSC